MESKTFFTLIFLFFYGINGDSLIRSKNPCSTVICVGDSLCWYDNQGTAQCENACDTQQCKEDEYCITQVGPCGDSSCRPVGKCYGLNPPSPCDGVTCPNGEQCSVVVPLNQKPVPICGRNPCVGLQCCPPNSGSICNNDGCYLETIDDFCQPGQPCQVFPVCRDPCQVQNVQCNEPGQFCYKSKAICITAPCNPIPECRKPCDTDIVNVCDQGYNCQVLWVNCVSDPNSPFYDPFCKPKEICVPGLPN